MTRKTKQIRRDKYFISQPNPLEDQHTWADHIQFPAAVLILSVIGLLTTTAATAAATNVDYLFAYSVPSAGRQIPSFTHS
ncbi:hypothetical protein Y032_0031g2327 [Ancylostoma ceylanicum]|uniref:Uncharacterized protein n=1 Tax=Ancylostoma ceylanicum TaxID=53326 RepID=A0A016UQT3_9BILA|nr:hypothetical protein Y032_0031g2327 [Ancylostoma ceylanicum]